MNNSEIKYRINKVCIAIFIFIGLLSVLQTAQIYIFAILYSAFGEKNTAISVSEDLFMGFSYLISYLSAALIYKKTNKNGYIPMRMKPSLGAHPLPMMSAGLGIMFMASKLVGMFSSGSGMLMDEYHGESIVLMVFTTALIPGFCEEFFFRGLIMTNLMPLGKSFAIIASGVIFGLVHGNHEQILFATFAGIVFGWIYSETGSIWCGILIHVFNNLIAVAETVLVGFMPEGTAIKLCMVIELGVVLCGAFSILYLIPRHKRSREEIYEKGCFGETTEKLLDYGVSFSLKEYMKGFFSPVMIAFLGYVALNALMYVFLVQYM